MVSVLAESPSPPLTNKLCSRCEELRFKRSLSILEALSDTQRDGGDRRWTSHEDQEGNTPVSGRYRI